MRTIGRLRPVLVVLALMATALPLSAAALAPSFCTVSAVGSDVLISWDDDGGRHVIRRNGSWLTTPGSGVDSYIDAAPILPASYELRTHQDGLRTDRACEAEPEPEPEPEPDGLVERVLHVSIDGLRADHVTSELMPNLSALRVTGSSTLNARSDSNLTKTLPNHTSQFTGRPVWGSSGHRVSYNQDLGRTVHDEARTHVTSVFDVVHENGGSTALFAGKRKFEMINRSWNDSIDVFERSAPDELVDPALDSLRSLIDVEYVFFHIRTPDSIGHENGWSSEAYIQAVTNADDILGALLGGIETDPDLADSTGVIVVADHGGPAGEDLHSDSTDEQNYTIPLVVWGPGVQEGGDLYAMNEGHRFDPGNGRPERWGPQPIRGHEVGNLVLDLLGYGSIPGSVFNAAQDLEFD